MTKKEQKLFDRILSLKYGFPDGVQGIYQFHNFYYASNAYMAVRSRENPALPMIPDATQRSAEKMYERVEKYFEDTILNGQPIALPAKKELAEARRQLSAKEKKNKAYIMDMGDMVFSLNNRYLSWFLDVFEDGRCFGHSPVQPFYFINKNETIDALLMPARVSKEKKARYIECDKKEHFI